MQRLTNYGVGWLQTDIRYNRRVQTIEWTVEIDKAEEEIIKSVADFWIISDEKCWICKCKII